MPNDVQEIAMFAGGRIGPLAGGTLRRVLEPHEHRAARAVVNVANQPIPPLLLAIGEIMSAHRLGLAREAIRQFGGIAAHHAASRSAMRSIGYCSSTFARISTPPSSVGTNMRSFQEMISLNRPYVLRRSRIASLNPDSSMRCLPMTRTRRSWRPSAR